MLEMFNTVGDLVRWEQQMTGDAIDDMLTQAHGITDVSSAYGKI
ncbi:MAG: hypothetical protein ACLSHL_09670 [Alistipes communis]